MDTSGYHGYVCTTVIPNYTFVRTNNGANKKKQFIIRSMYRNTVYKCPLCEHTSLLLKCKNERRMNEQEKNNVYNVISVQQTNSQLQTANKIQNVASTKWDLWLQLWIFPTTVRLKNRFHIVELVRFNLSFVC